MTDIVVASPDEVRRVVEAFWDLSWPQPKAAVMETAETLGWSVDVDHEGGAYFRTGYGTGDALASAVLVGPELAKQAGYALGDLMEITVPLTSVADASDAGQKRAVAAASRSLIGVVTELLGAPSGKITSRSRVFWDTPTGGRITVQKLSMMVTLVVGSAAAADIERGEARFGTAR